MNPADFLFVFLGKLTGGFVTDTQTLLLAFVLLGFLKFGAEILIEKLQGAAIRHKTFNAFHAAQDLRSLRNSSQKGSFEYEYYNAMYRAKFSSAVGMASKHNVAYLTPLEKIDEVSSSDLIEELGEEDLVEEINEGDFLENDMGEIPLIEYSGFSAADPGPLDGDRPYWA